MEAPEVPRAVAAAMSIASSLDLTADDAIWITPGRLEALIPGRIQSHGGTAEVPRGAA
jgi:hypothetical protein